MHHARPIGSSLYVSSPTQTALRLCTLSLVPLALTLWLVLA